jgi:SAM-dependent methyltransferase
MSDADSLPRRPRAERAFKLVEREINRHHQDQENISTVGEGEMMSALRRAQGHAERKSGKYVCVLCNCAFGKLKNFEQHVAGKQHSSNSAAIDDIWTSFKTCADTWGAAGGVEALDREGGRMYVVNNETVTIMDVVKAWNEQELMLFPMRTGAAGRCMSPSTTFTDLPLYLKARLWKYTSELMPYYPELPLIVSGMDPRLLRVKELFESFEAFKMIENFMVGAKKWREIKSVFDVGCGHGLVGMLIAYRFPKMTVVGVDVAVRPAQTAWRLAFERKGQKLAHWDAALANYRLVKGGVEDLHDLSKLAPRQGDADEDESKDAQRFQVVESKDLDSTGLVVNSTGLVVSVHGCNQVNSIAIETAIACEALWATLPCCVPDSLYLPSASIKLADDLGDNVRHIFMCGVMAERYDAQLVCEMAKAITNRGVMIAGGVTQLACASAALDDEDDTDKQRKLVGFSRRIRKVASAYSKP